MAAAGQDHEAHGVVIGSGAAPESMGAVDAAGFDKAGTLTTGAPVYSAGPVLDVPVAALLHDRDFPADGREDARFVAFRRGGRPAGAA